MRRRAWIPRPFLVALIGTGLLLSTTVLAQPVEPDLGPFYDVNTIPDGRPWLQWLIGGLFIAACLAVAIRNPHRTHLD